MPTPHDGRGVVYYGPPINLTPMAGRWTRFCWWLSRLVGGRTVLGKRDES